MNAKREIVIEYERIQLIRKRAKTELACCCKCSRQSDFVSLRDAAELFEAKESDLFDFAQNNDCHYRGDTETSIQLCITSLLACMRSRTLDQQIKLIGD